MFELTGGIRRVDAERIGQIPPDSVQLIEAEWDELQKIERGRWGDRHAEWKARVAEIIGQEGADAYEQHGNFARVWCYPTHNPDGSESEAWRIIKANRCAPDLDVPAPFLFVSWKAFCNAQRERACDELDYDLASFWRDEADYGYDWYMGQEITLTLSPSSPASTTCPRSS